MLPVCEPGDSYSTAWREYGFSRCFLQLVGAISGAGILYVLGLGTLVLGKNQFCGSVNVSSLLNIKCTGKPPKYSKGLVSDFPFSWVYVVEVVCTLLYSLSFACDLATKGALHIAGERIYGYTIVVDALGVVSWLFSLLLIHREKTLIVTNRHHGFTLALFWLVGVVWVGLELVSFHSPFWWWHLKSRADIADITLFLFRAVVLTLLVVVGLFRPICCPGHRRAYSLLINADSAAEDSAVPVTGDAEGTGSEVRKRKEGDFVRRRTTSAFSGIWSKVCRLFPYVWPKGMTS